MQTQFDGICSWEITHMYPHFFHTTSLPHIFSELCDKQISRTDWVKYKCSHPFILGYNNGPKLKVYTCTSSSIWACQKWKETTNHIEGWERKRSKCYFTYIHLDLFRSHSSICKMQILTCTLILWLDTNSNAEAVFCQNLVQPYVG